MNDRKRGSDAPEQLANREQTQKADGVNLDELSTGSVLDVETEHRHYRLEKQADAHVRISGHPTFCPQPIDVEIEGSLGKGRKLQFSPHFIGRGMFLVFKDPVFDRIITTSRVRDVHKVEDRRKLD